MLSSAVWNVDVTLSQPSPQPWCDLHDVPCDHLWSDGNIEITFLPSSVPDALSSASVLKLTLCGGTLALPPCSFVLHISLVKAGRQDSEQAHYFCTLPLSTSALSSIPALFLPLPSPALPLCVITCERGETVGPATLVCGENNPGPEWSQH